MMYSVFPPEPPTVVLVWAAAGPTTTALTESATAATSALTSVPWLFVTVVPPSSAKGPRPRLTAAP